MLQTQGLFHSCCLERHLEAEVHFQARPHSSLKGDASFVLILLPLVIHISSCPVDSWTGANLTLHKPALPDLVPLAFEVNHFKIVCPRCYCNQIVKWHSTKTKRCNDEILQMHMLFSKFTWEASEHTLEMSRDSWREKWLEGRFWRRKSAQGGSKLFGWGSVRVWTTWGVEGTGSVQKVSAPGLLASREFVHHEVGENKITY